MLLLDQRGTGRSTPQNRQTLAALPDAVSQARHLAHSGPIRSCVTRGAGAPQAARRRDQWTVLGQSFGVLRLTYLSLAPEGCATSSSPVVSRRSVAPPTTSTVRRTSAMYVLDAGGTVTHPFRIDPNVWRQTIWKALNFFYAERCGMAIPGIHGVCHRDWQVVHGDKRIVINGGWHDAGDLTQGASKRPRSRTACSAWRSGYRPAVKTLNCTSGCWKKPSGGWTGF